MLISIIAAMGHDRVIGRDNALPWKLPADMRRFRHLTMGKPVLMGRKTHQSIGWPLPGRTNIVLSRDLGFSAEGCIVVDSLEQALDNAAEIMIIGGAAIYQQTLPRAERLYLTYIDHSFAGDQFFPEFDASEWVEQQCEEHAPDERNVYRYRFVTLARRKARHAE